MRKTDLLKLITIAVLLLFPLYSQSEDENEIAKNRKDAACLLSSGGHCLKKLSAAIGKQSPELTIDMAIVMKKLTKSITKVQGDLFENLITRDYVVSAFENEVKTCEGLAAKLSRQQES